MNGPLVVNPGLPPVLRSYRRTVIHHQRHPEFLQLNEPLIRTTDDKEGHNEPVLPKHINLI
jgi:hypothetical protein